MGRWQIELSEQAEKDLAVLDHFWRRRIIDKLNWLADNFDDVTPLPLSESWGGFFKLRVGDWRVIYKIDYSIYLLIVHYIDRRDKIYKRKIK